MQITKIVFSPTGGTQKVLDILTGALATEQGAASGARQIDLGDPFINETDIEMAPDSLAVVAMPCFGGRARSGHEAPIPHKGHRRKVHRSQRVRQPRLR